MSSIHFKGGDFDDHVKEVSEAAPRLKFKIKGFFSSKGFYVYKNTGNLDNGGRPVYVYCGYENDKGNFQPVFYPGLKFILGDLPFVVTHMEVMHLSGGKLLPLAAIEGPPTMPGTDLFKAGGWIDPQILGDLLKLGAIKLLPEEPAVIGDS